MHAIAEISLVWGAISGLFVAAMCAWVLVQNRLVSWRAGRAEALLLGAALAASAGCLYALLQHT